MVVEGDYIMVNYVPNIYQNTTLYQKDHCIAIYGTAHFQFDTHSRALTELLYKYFNLLANYLWILKEQWRKHIHVATNRMPSALVWNALVWIYLWTRAEYTLLECARVECIDSYGVHWNHYTSCKPFILYVKLSVQLLFNLCSQTILALATHWFNNRRRCIPYLQFNITYEESLLTS